MSSELSVERWRLAKVGEVAEGWATGARDDEGTFDISDIYYNEEEARERARAMNSLYPRAGMFTLPVVRKG